ADFQLLGLAVHQRGEGFLNSVIVGHQVFLGACSTSSLVPGHGRQQLSPAKSNRYDHLIAIQFSPQDSPPIIFLICWSMASRARNIRERTVPTGQSITVAMSS